MTARTLMVQGASSSAGKSLLVAALCHIFARRGVQVAPFKAQNMSNNAAVCPDGAEIGRAQAVQALASGLAPRADFNPVLIKPEADARSQVIVNGRPFQTLDAVDYYSYKKLLWAQVTASLERLRSEFELVIIEGAGSPVELNLKEGDIVNMAVARYAQSPVLLVGDIDRGGIFAQLLGTLWLLEPVERALVRGLIVNKFRGDLRLFQPGVKMLAEMGGLPVLGVIPYLHDLRLPEEDAVALESAPVSSQRSNLTSIDLAVIHLPRISNFDDFDSLQAEPGVRLRYAHSASELGEPGAILLPGTKSTAADLEWLRASGLAEKIIAFAQRGGAVVGICGGFQMLGRVIWDPEQIESHLATIPGLGLLPIETTFEREKATYQAQACITGGMGWMSALKGRCVAGYEIHMGRTQANLSWLEITERNGRPVRQADGASSPDGRIWGSYLHGLFANLELRRAWLSSLGWANPAPENELLEADRLQGAFARLADEVEAALDLSELERIIWEA